MVLIKILSITARLEFIFVWLNGLCNNNRVWFSYCLSLGLSCLEPSLRVCKALAILNIDIVEPRGTCCANSRRKWINTLSTPLLNCIQVAVVACWVLPSDFIIAWIGSEWLRIRIEERWCCCCYQSFLSHVCFQMVRINFSLDYPIETVKDVFGIVDRLIETDGQIAFRIHLYFRKVGHNWKF